MPRYRGGRITTLNRNRQAKGLGPAEATTLAIRGLAFLASDEDVLGRFLGTTGLAVDELGARAEDPVLLGAVLDFLLGDEPLLLRFCTEVDCAPELPARARAKLPGFMPPD